MDAAGGAGRQAGGTLERTATTLFWAATVGFLVIFAFNSLTRRDDFSDPDTMNFVDVARNVAAGRGLTQSTLGFNQPHFSLSDPIPVPFTSQPPLYPLLVAALAGLGMPAVAAALLVTGLAYGVTLGLVYQLGRELFDRPAALLAVGLLLLYDPLYQLGSRAFSDLTGLALAVGCLWLLARWARLGANQAALIMAAGVAAGLALATRYALAPLAAVGVAVIWAEAARRRRSLMAFGLGFLIPAGLVWGHNWLVSGALMPRPNPSTVGLATNLAQTFGALLGTYLPGSRLDSNAQMVVGLGGLALVGAGLAARRRLAATLREVLIAQRRYLLSGWSLLYLAFLVVQRTLTHFDDINARLVLPASAVLLLILAAGLAEVGRGKRELAVYGALLAALVALGRETQFAVSTPPVDRGAPVAQSAVMSWIATDTAARDLIVGMDTVYVPFYFGGRPALSFSPYPYTDYLDYRYLQAYIGKHCGDYEHVYLVLRDLPGYDEARWKASFGPFVADLALARWQTYRGVDLWRRLADGTVFTLRCR